MAQNGLKSQGIEPEPGELIYETPEALAAALELSGADPDGAIKSQLTSIGEMVNSYGSWEAAVADYNTMSYSDQSSFVDRYNTTQPEFSTSPSIDKTYNGGMVTQDGLLSWFSPYPDLTSDKFACAKRFSLSLRIRTHWVGQHQNSIDYVGRPNNGIALIPPFSAEARDTKCQSWVGNLGNNEMGIVRTSSNRDVTYDGGHLTPTSIGGWKRRINLVPQNTQLNQDALSQLDAVMAKCVSFLPRTFIFQTRAFYPNSTTNIPSSFITTIAFPRNSKRYTVRHLEFKNEHPYKYYPAGTFTYSPYATTAKQMIEDTVGWLKRAGCV